MLYLDVINMKRKEKGCLKKNRKKKTRILYNVVKITRREDWQSVKDIIFCPILTDKYKLLNWIETEEGKRRIIYSRFYSTGKAERYNSVNC